MQHTAVLPKSQDKSSREETLQIAAHIFDTFSYTQYLKDPHCGLPFSTSPSLDLQPSVHVEVYESLLRVRVLNRSTIPHNPPTRVAGDIKQFSNNSRMRAFKWLKSLQTRILSEAIFITLTYHNETDLTPLNHWEDLQKFVRWLRENVDGCVYIWRREYQKRGMVNFHFIVWSRAKIGPLYSSRLQRKISDAWIQIKPCKCDACHLYSCKVMPVSSKLHTSAYLNKYISKSSDLPATGTIGRYWGTTSDAPTDALFEIDFTISQRDKLKALVKKFLRAQKTVPAEFLDRLETLDSYSVFVETDIVGQCLAEIMDTTGPPTALKLSPLLLAK